ncbi:MAG: glycosyltransferase family A protein [Acidimicrobiaceae bacterium]|nr:glycosyltransferase family A protein [Acidimicrobiaceae bacterium]
MADHTAVPQPWGSSLGPLARLLETLGLDLSGSENLAPLVRPAPAVPAFTVILRTQGLRPRTLREALQSLAAQTWTSFDAIVAVHAAAEVAADVEADVAAAAAAAAAPADWRVLPVGEGGSRSRPLNAGVEAADGDYVTFLDDDDLAEPNWLAVFARAAADAPGQIIRARTAWQPWRTDGTAEPRTPAGPVDHITPAGFDQLAHFSRCETAICSLALPRHAFDSFGLRFDEQLTVYEDWDLLVRAALVLGVHCVDEVTTLYRRSDGANSLTAADPMVWNRNRAMVIEKLSRQPFVLDGLNARRLAEEHFEYGGGPSKRLDTIPTRDMLAALPQRLRNRLLKTLRERRTGA